MQSLIITANMGEDSISFISLNDFRTIKKIKLKPLHSKFDIDRIFMNKPAVGPCRLVYGRDKKNLYCINAYDNSISRIDLQDSCVSSTIFVGAHPADLCISPNNDLIFVCCSDSNSVSVIEKDCSKLIETVPVGLFPQSIDIRKDGHLIAVANTDSRSISFIDRRGAICTATLSLDASPIQTVFNHNDGQLYVISACPDFQNAGIIYVIDPCKKKIVKEILMDYLPANIVFLNDKTRALVTNCANQDVRLININNGKTLDSILVGNMPQSIWLQEDMHIALITNMQDDTVSILDIVDLKVVHTIRTGREPSAALLI